MANAITLWEGPAFYRGGSLQKPLSSDTDSKINDAKKKTLSHSILKKHNTSLDEKNLKIKFDKITSHDITYVGIIQTARASGLTKFSIPYVLTNCHNSLCAVGGTINEDDHMFGLSCAKKYGGVYVPPHMAVIHQYAREMLAKCGDMILGSDSHTRYGALGTMAIGEGGGELAKQLLGKTYDIAMPRVVAVFLKGEVIAGVGPQDVSLSIIKSVFEKGFVKNCVMEFLGPGIKNLSADFRIGIDVMTTETTCLSSIWETDEKIREFYAVHGREADYADLRIADGAYYDAAMEIDLSKIRPMIAMPFHPSCAYEIDEVNANLSDVIFETEKRAKIAFGEKINFSLKEKISEGKLFLDQGIIAGCAGGSYENICAAADILRGRDTGSGKFLLSVYPASVPIYQALIKNGAASSLLSAGAILKTAFCGPCFGAGDTPSNGALSARHSTRNFPNREGSKITFGQMSSVALMDARSIAASAAAGGVLTSALEFDFEFSAKKYFFEKEIYEKRVFDSHGVHNPKVEIHFGPNIKDWPLMPALRDDLLLKIVSEIHDPVTTTDELIPSGETSSYRSNPLGLAEFTLSRRDPEYVGRAKAVRDMSCEVKAEIDFAISALKKSGIEISKDVTIASSIFAKKPGDGSAREQAASCQRVLGAAANIAFEYATKRYRSNLINWGMIPFLLKAEGDAATTKNAAEGSAENSCDAAADATAEKNLPFKNCDYVFVPNAKRLIEEGADSFKAYAVSGAGGVTQFEMTLGDLTSDERKIILAGCLINFYKEG